MPKPKKTHAPTKTSVIAPAEPSPAKVLASLRPRYAAIAAKDVLPLSADVGAAGIAAHGIAQRANAPGLRKRFEKLASIGEFDLADLDLLPLAAIAAQHARLDADKAIAKGTGTKIPLAIVKEAAVVEK